MSVTDWTCCFFRYGFTKVFISHVFASTHSLIQSYFFQSTFHGEERFVDHRCVNSFSICSRKTSCRKFIVIHSILVNSLYQFIIAIYRKEIDANGYAGLKYCGNSFPISIFILHLPIHQDHRLLLVSNKN